MKTNVTLSVDKGLVEKMKKVGINFEEDIK